MDNYQIKAINDGHLVKQFIDFPHDLYAGDPNYVPEIYLGQKEVHSKTKNPFFKHGTVQLYLVYKGKSIVGRIAAIDNGAYNAFHNCKVGFFGFFDCIDDYAVAKMLLDTATEWCKARKLTEVIGPANYSLTTDTGGLLIDGFDKPPIVMMTYNKSYYQGFIERYGFVKAMDLFAYMIYTAKASEKSIRLSGMLETRLKTKGITVRNLNLKKFKEEVAKVKEIYAEAWENNWGFNPPSAAEFDHLAEGLKLILDGDFAYIAEHDGKAIGFAVTLPNINEIMISQRKGRILPFGVIKLLTRKSKTDYVRVALLGVLPEYRKLGIEAIFFAKNIETARRRNVIGGEASWILENNSMMVQAAEKLNGEKYKTYRVYSYNLS